MKINQALNGDLTAVATTFGEDFANAATAPMGLFKSNADSNVERSYVSPRTAAIGAVGYFVGGFMLGDRFGDTVPYLGQGRV